MAYGNDDGSPGSKTQGTLASGPGAIANRPKVVTSFLLPSQVWTANGPFAAGSEFRTIYSIVAFVIVAASAVIFASLFVSASKLGGGDFYRAILREDGVFEYIEALLFLLTSVVMLFCWRQTANDSYDGPWINKVLFLIAGLIFLVGAGEEISWGQRIFLIETPQYLKEINSQGEINFHNINKSFFDRAVAYTVVFLTLMSAALHLCKISSICKIRTPSILLLVSLCITSLYKQYHQPFYKSGMESYVFLYKVFNPDALSTSLVYISLAVIIVTAIYRNNETGAPLTLLGAGFALIFSVINMSLHVEMRESIWDYFHLIDETREYLLAVCLFAYSLEIASQLKDGQRSNSERDDASCHT